MPRRAPPAIAPADILIFVLPMPRALTPWAFFSGMVVQAAVGV